MLASYFCGIPQGKNTNRIRHDLPVRRPYVGCLRAMADIRQQRYMRTGNMEDTRQVRTRREGITSSSAHLDSSITIEKWSTMRRLPKEAVKNVIIRVNLFIWRAYSLFRRTNCIVHMVYFDLRHFTTLISVHRSFWRNNISHIWDLVSYVALQIEQITEEGHLVGCMRLSYGL